MRNKYFFIFLLSALAFVACKEEATDSTAPGKVTDISYVATNGGAILSFTAPADDDLLFVKAVYTNALGKEVFKVTSRYTETIEIDGFMDETPQKVRLYAVDANNNASEPAEIVVTPNRSFIFNVLESIELRSEERRVGEKCR